MRYRRPPVPRRGFSARSSLLARCDGLGAREATTPADASYTVIRVRADRVDDDAAHHVRTRSQRYPDAIDIEPYWTAQAVNDPDRIVDEPDRHSAHANSVRVVGYSHSAAMLITVVALRDRRGVL